MDMDASTLTHVAAILVGVVVTLTLVNSFSNKTGHDVAAHDVVPSNGGVAASASAAAAKRKKKKAKKKGTAAPGAAAAAAAAAAVPTIVAPPHKSTKSTKSKEEKKATPVPKAPALALAPTPPVTTTTSTTSTTSTNGASSSSTAKVASKKKKKKGQSNNNNNNNSKAPAPVPAAPTPAPAAAAAPAPTPAPTSSSNDVWETLPTQQDEGEWASVPTTKAKKNKKKQSKAGVAAAAAANAATGAPPASTQTESVVIDGNKVGIIIGPKGATMKAIQEATGCQLEVNAPPKDEATGPKGANASANANAKATVVISGGDKEAMKQAKTAIQELATKGYARLLQGESFGEFSIQVHPKYLNEIVGPKGKNIQAVQTACQVKLTIPSTEWKPNAPQLGKAVPFCNVGIAGSKENSKTTKQVLQTLMKFHHTEVTHPGMIHEELYVPQEFFHCVIGTRGSEIKHIRGNYQVDVYMPSRDSYYETDNVLVVGKQANVDKSISYIKLLMDRDTESRERKYNDEFYG